MSPTQSVTYNYDNSVLLMLYIHYDNVAWFIWLLGIEPLCLKPDNILNASYTVAMPISTTINSGQLHHNVIVMGRVIRNATNVSGTDETALMFLLGSVAHYSCDEGYVMTGSNTLMCFINGSWIGDIGSCESMCILCV